MKTILVETGPVTTVTLNRPDARNAFNETLIEELTAWAEAVSTDGSVRVVLLQGAGPVFSAGADLNWMSKMIGYSREENLADARRLARMFQALDTLPAAVIGRIHGAALGGGIGLAAICDTVVASDDTLFGFTETRLGIVPAIIAPYAVRKIGLSAARDQCLGGAQFPASKALTLGLVHEVVPPEQLDEAVNKRVHQVLQAAPSAVYATKKLLSQMVAPGPADLADLSVEVIAAQRVSVDGQEGMSAFFAKRKPSWQ